MVFCLRPHKDQRLVTQGWYRPIDVVVFPINAAQDTQTGSYIDSLRATHFTEVEKFFQSQGKRYNVIATTPITIHLGTTLEQLPPAIPALDSPRLKILWWSLKMRWWAYRNSPIPDGLDSNYTINAYVLYHDPQKNHRLQHSIGLQKGLLTVVHAFADPQYTKQNNIILAHEILHAFGASDKYDPATQLPIHPQGFAYPDQEPLYPQKYAEIMAVKRPQSATQAEMPTSLRKVSVNSITAGEIGWLHANTFE